MKKQKLYVVWIGRKPGIYKSWDDCKKQIDEYPNGKFRSVKVDSHAEAKELYDMGWEKGMHSKVQYLQINKNQTNYSLHIEDSICVDGACKVMPGSTEWEMEYRGVDPKSGEEIFISPVYKSGTNSIAEFLAIIHAMKWIKDRNLNKVIYSDSQTAITWADKKAHKSKLFRNKANEETWKSLDYAIKWLNEQSSLPKVYKWKNNQWGENPADFNRK
ncbi:viroplasmin family protein [Bacillus cereus]|uniref:Ribonuclease H n=1 Tax=Bacillus cereus TaxID=1396 RepID=A0A164QE79_BACCE|nr:ribonuclease H family protein [Bacillus cereus]KZD71191.1 Ribonuclease HI-related protein 3 [Bacillus cereus]HDR8321338.1 ribonuclease H family protein [Bacillus cereus]HDR8330988.1 ribonuclease H family protein [Bacillus cereus]HDR8336342.1 ribonuclease H family protein [Bacillus cereus]